MLERYGFDELSICVIISYLTDRAQQTRIDNIASDKIENNFGTPQGSGISPLLFALYLGDMENVTRLDITTYVDDTVIMAVGDTVQAVREQLEEEGNKVVTYLSNKLMEPKSKEIQPNDV